MKKLLSVVLVLTVSFFCFAEAPKETQQIEPYSFEEWHNVTVGDLNYTEISEMAKDCNWLSFTKTFSCENDLHDYDFEVVRENSLFIRKTCSICHKTVEYSKKEFIREYAPFYAVPGDIHIKKIKTEEDFFNNAQYHFLLGEYEFDLVFSDNDTAKTWFKNEFSKQDPSKNIFNRWDKFKNSNIELTECHQGKQPVSQGQFDNKISFRIKKPMVDPAEYFIKSLRGIELVKKFYVYAHALGAIVPDMTEEEIIKAYCNILTEKVGCKSPNKNEFGLASGFDVPGIYFCNVWDCLSGNKAMDPARCIAIIHLLRMEGIQAQAVRYSNDDPKQGFLYHGFIIRGIADGQEVFFNWRDFKSSDANFFVYRIEDVPMYNVGVRPQTDYVKRF